MQLLIKHMSSMILVDSIIYRINTVLFLFFIFAGLHVFKTKITSRYWRD